MKMIPLPNGKIINPAHVESVNVHPHFWNSEKFYVQLKFRRGETTDIEERLDRETADAVRDKCVKLIQEAAADISAYQVGYEEGTEHGRGVGYTEGHSQGWKEGYGRGRAEAYEIEQKGFLSNLYEFQAELIAEQQSCSQLSPDRRRYLKHSISAITEFIERISPYDARRSLPRNTPQGRKP
jgi:flagellar biosynthesis/type III secretory pathway protein FliH